MRRISAVLSRAFLIAAVLALTPALRAQSGDFGKVDFPTSGSADAQKHFIRGVLLLHSFEYPDARAAFKKAQEVEPGFAMAYWGEAMTHNHPIWDQQDRKAAREALNRLAPSWEGRMAKAPTDRERAYLKTLEVLYGEGDKTDRDFAYSAAMHELQETYPDDNEAASFYALSILGTVQGKRDFRTYMRAASVVEEVFAENSLHPGAAHYLIHSYDDPIHAPLGLRAARVYADIAPDAPHALHMPSHVFMALGMWDESGAMNERSAAAAPKASGSWHHATWWLHYSYLQQGRYKEARRLLDDMETTMAEDPEARYTHRHVANMRSSYIIETRYWSDELVDKEIDFGKLGLKGRASIYLARGMAAIETQEIDKAEKILTKLGVLLQEGDQDQDEFETAQLMQKQIAAVVELAQGKGDQAVVLMAEAAALQENMRYEFGPTMPVKPVHELHGEILLKLDRPKEALGAFRKALGRDPKRALSLLGLARAHQALGNEEASAKAYNELKQVWYRADPELSDREGPTDHGSLGRRE